MWDSPMHLLIVLIFPLLILFGLPFVGYQIGKKVGDSTGYVRGYKEGQQSSKTEPPGR